MCMYSLFCGWGGELYVELKGECEFQTTGLCSKIEDAGVGVGGAKSAAKGASTRELHKAVQQKKTKRVSLFDCESVQHGTAQENANTFSQVAQT